MRRRWASAAVGLLQLPPPQSQFSGKKKAHTILFKIITRMKLLFSNYLGGYSYSFQGSSELISITVTVSLFFLQNALQEIIPLRNFQEFLAITVT